MNLIPWQRKHERIEREPSAVSLASLREEMDSLFDRFIRNPLGWGEFENRVAGTGGVPPTDLADSPDEVTVTMELPGVDPKDVDISITGDLLVVRGEKREVKEETKKAYRYVERHQGRFQRTIRLPATIDPGKVEARFKNGVLTISVAKNPEARPQRIAVRDA